MQTELTTGGQDQSARRVLCRVEDGSPFAYARGDEFIRSRDHALWAHFSNGWLLSARSGDRLAFQRGSLFYDAETGAPVYYETPGTAPR